MSNAIPLADVLPWQVDFVSTSGRTILVCDSAGTDGRFLLHTMALQTLRPPSTAPSSSAAVVSRDPLQRASAVAAGLVPPATRSSSMNRNPTSKAAPAAVGGRVLWLGCTPATDQQVASALKKIGCDVSVTTAAVLPDNTTDSMSNVTIRPKRLEIIPIMFEVASSIADESQEGRVGHEYLKKLYRRIKAWLNQQPQQQQDTPVHHLVVIDDVTALATIFGQLATDVFVRQVRSTLRRSSNASDTRIGCLAMLCSNDADQDRHLADVSSSAEGGGSSVNVTGGGRKGDWIGSAGDTFLEEAAADATPSSTCAWERSLVEIADGIIDVVPLQSGFSLEAHGRLVFTERRGGLGWRDSRKTSGAGLSSSSTSSSSFLTTVVNYCCEESTVKAFRLRST